MKWKGIVSQLGQATMAPRFTAANTTQPTSTNLGRKSVPRVTDRLDRGAVPELLA